GPAERRLRQVLRVGALVSYAASADEVFHERAECWIDVPSRRELPDPAVREVRRYVNGGSRAAGPRRAPPAGRAVRRPLSGAGQRPGPGGRGGGTGPREEVLRRGPRLAGPPPG